MGGAGWRAGRGAGDTFRVPNIADTVLPPARPKSHKALTVGRVAQSLKAQREATRSPSEHLLSRALEHVANTFSKGLLAAQSA